MHYLFRSTSEATSYIQGIAQRQGKFRDSFFGLQEKVETQKLRRIGNHISRAQWLQISQRA
jgi:hypothetical protein